MYDTKMFNNYLDSLVSKYGHQERSFCNEFKNLNDDELLEKLNDYVGYMTTTNIDSDLYVDYFQTVQRIMECMNTRKNYREMLAEVA